MIENLKLKLQMWYEDFMWRYGPERLELAHNRLAAHEKAMAGGYESPYTDPENYDVNWNVITIRRKRA